MFKLQKKQAIDALRGDSDFTKSIDNDGLPYGSVLGILAAALPDTMDDRQTVAYGLVPEAVSEILGGVQGVAWDTNRRQSKSGKDVTFIFKKNG